MNLRGKNPKEKSIRDRERMVEFRKQRKEIRTDSVLRILPFSTADISVIQCETIETEVEKIQKAGGFAKEEYGIL